MTKRLHIHVKTDDLGKSVAYYNALFGEAPVKLEDDYAKWLLEDPPAHVSVSTHCGSPGIDHAGVSIETPEELEAIATRLAAAGMPAAPEKATTCCYAHSDKYWSKDPQGATWELFHSYGESADYGSEPERTESCGR